MLSNALLEQELFWTVLCLQLINKCNRIKLAKARISFRCRLLILPQASFYDVIISLWAICSWKRTLYFKTPPYLKLKTCIFLIVQTPTPPRQCLNSPPRARTTVKCLWVAWGRCWSFELTAYWLSKKGDSFKHFSLKKETLFGLTRSYFGNLIQFDGWLVLDYTFSLLTFYCINPRFTKLQCKPEMHSSMNRMIPNVSPWKVKVVCFILDLFSFVT